MAETEILVKLAESGASIEVDSTKSKEIILTIIKKLQPDCTLTIRKASKFLDTDLESLAKVIKPLPDGKVIFDFSE